MNGTEVELSRGLVENGPILLRIIEVAVLTGTAIIIFYYTRETKRLRKETQKQTEQIIQPLLIIEYNLNDNLFYLKNISNGTALNVNINIESYMDNKFELSFKYESSFIKGNDYITAVLCDREKGYPVLSSFDVALLECAIWDEKPFIIFITYDNVVFQKYYTKMKLTYQGNDLIDFGKLDR